MEVNYKRQNASANSGTCFRDSSSLSLKSRTSRSVRTPRCQGGRCSTSGTQTMDWPMTYDEMDESFGMSVKDIEYLDSDDSSSSDSPDSEGVATSAVSALDAKTRVVSRPRTLDLRREVLVYRTAAPGTTLPREHLKLRPTRSLEPTSSTSSSGGQSYKTNGRVQYKEEPTSGRYAGGTESTTSPTLDQLPESSAMGLQPPKPKQKLRAVRSLDTTLANNQDNSDAGQDSDHSIKSASSPSPSTKRRFPYLQKLAASMRVGIHHHHSSGSMASTPSPGNDGPDGGAVFDDGSSPPQGLSPLTSPKTPDSLSSPSSPSVMQRMKLPGSPSQKLNPRKLWRGKGHHSGKLQTSPVLTTSLWAPVGNYWWQSVTGRRLQLSTVDISNISEIERRHLQKAAYHRLQAYNVGPIILPRDPLQKRPPKKGGLLRTGRQRTSSFLDSLRDIARDNKDAPSSPLVFGIALEKCIRNDRELRLYEANKQRERRESLDLAQPLRNPSTLSEHSVCNTTSNKLARSVSSPSSSRPPGPGGRCASNAANAYLLDALSLSTAAMEECRQMRRKSLAPLEAQVPRLVAACFRHLEQHGIHVLGIFRVGGSKKRIRQLREDLDMGESVQLNSSISPHDVGALLKEYFRDLPEPLLTRELYTAFVGTAKLSNSIEQQKEALRLLVYLLPIAHRDTLSALLSFLHDVAMNSADIKDEDGHEQQGNKMDSINLATLFGPNILRRTKSGELKGEAADHMEENRDVIQVVQRLIDHNDELFTVSGEMHDEVLRRLQDMDPEALDYLINKISKSIRSEEEDESRTAPDGKDDDGSKFHVSQSDNLLQLHECNSLGSDMYATSDDSCLDRRKGSPRTHEWLLRGSVKSSTEVTSRHVQKANSLPRTSSGSNSGRTASNDTNTTSLRLNNMLANCDEVTIPDAVSGDEDAELDSSAEKHGSRRVSPRPKADGIEIGSQMSQRSASPSPHRPPPRLIIPQESSTSRTPSPKTFRVTSTSPRQRSVSQPPEYGSVQAGQQTKKESDVWIPVFDMQATGLYSPQMPRRSYLEQTHYFSYNAVEVNNNNSAGQDASAPEHKTRTSTTSPPPQSSEDVGLTTIKTTVTPTHIEWSLTSETGKTRNNSELSSPPSTAWFTPPSTPDTPRSVEGGVEVGSRNTPPSDAAPGSARPSVVGGNPNRTSLAMTRTSWDASADDEEWVKRWEFLTSDEDGEFWGQETLV